MSVASILGWFITRAPWQPPCTPPDGYGCIPIEWIG